MFYLFFPLWINCINVDRSENVNLLDILQSIQIISNTFKVYDEVFFSFMKLFKNFFLINNQELKNLYPTYDILTCLTFQKHYLSYFRNKKIYKSEFYLELPSCVVLPDTLTFNNCISTNF